ncbi:MAG TPA: TetR/AcrR family transcriptional regulator [bacterium]
MEKGAPKKETKQKIFQTAIHLFARRGYDAVGIREIAKTAGVQISMINYYFEGKVGILREIVNETYRMYFETILSIGDESVALEQRMKTLVKNMVDFFRFNTELTIVGISAMPLDIPEIADLRIKWVTENRASLNRLFSEMGLDIKDDIKMSVVRSFLTNVIFGHFEGKYSWDLIINAPAKPKLLPKLEEINAGCRVSEDDFYRQYADTLATFYINGIKSIAAQDNK